MKKKVKSANFFKEKSFLILIRYLILLGIMFSLPLIYRIFAPLTIYPAIVLLKLFFTNVSLHNSTIIINSKTFININNACIAGSAYLLLLILIFSISMSIKKRIFSILLSFALLLSLNIMRIFFLSSLYYNNFALFDVTHKTLWYLLSTLFVIGIWFLTAKIFSIKEIPVYDDIRYLVINIKNKKK